MAENTPQKTENTAVDSPSWTQAQLFWTVAHPLSQGSRDVNFWDLLGALWRGKWFILLCVFLACVLGYLATRMMTPKYTAQVSLMPLNASGSEGLGQILSQVSAIPLLGDQAEKMSGGGRSKDLVNILESRAMAEKIVTEFDLMKIIFAQQWDPQKKAYHATWKSPQPLFEDAVRIFRKKKSEIKADKKTGLVLIKVTLPDAELAAKVANRMALELQDFLSNNALTMAKRNRIFLEEQLVHNRSKLLESGKELSQFYAQNQISSVVPKLNVNAGSYEPLPKTFEDFRREFEKLGQQQGQVQRKKETSIVQGVPGQVYLEYLTQERQLLGQIYALLSQQYELSKIDETKEDLAFQVLDRAIPTARQSSPVLIINIAVAFILSLMMAVMIVVFKEYRRASSK